MVCIPKWVRISFKIGVRICSKCLQPGKFQKDRRMCNKCTGKRKKAHELKMQLIAHGLLPNSKRYD